MRSLSDTLPLGQPRSSTCLEKVKIKTCTWLELRQETPLISSTQHQWHSWPRTFGDTLPFVVISLESDLHLRSAVRSKISIQEQVQAKPAADVNCTRWQRSRSASLPLTLRQLHTKAHHSYTADTKTPPACELGSGRPTACCKMCATHILTGSRD